MTRHLATDEERRSNRLASYGKYNVAHREERKLHNRVYSKQEHVKARRRELYRLKSAANVSASEAPRLVMRSSDE